MKGIANMIYDIYVLEHELDKKDSDEVLKRIVADLSENYKTSCGT